ncbi:hypothetical protein BZARG_1470 [Bizionia argentinensis JUB59]|uniref:Uncharacterized protein n=1 Tax=Bizionia argentinensis JUB59 TaxID=1046627 RepID=G2EC46_9FLAO|nr:hypothetical protein [Bizionia argentinensis]EGV44039.1 hypothetical protein BZARG_1470 [Bizionia argentinensis JUB59]
MKNRKLHTNKESGFKTPDSYFKDFEETLLSELVLKEKCKTSGFNVPDDYFKNFETSNRDTVLEEKKETKVIPLFSKKTTWYAASAAAIAILLISLPDFKESVSFSSLDNDSIENYILSNDYEASDFNNLITDPSAFENAIYNETLSDVSLESYLYYNSDLEDLN